MSCAHASVYFDPARTVAACADCDAPRPGQKLRAPFRGWSHAGTFEREEPWGSRPERKLVGSGHKHNHEAQR